MPSRAAFCAGSAPVTRAGAGHAFVSATLPGSRQAGGRGRRQAAHPGNRGRPADAGPGAGGRRARSRSARRALRRWSARPPASAARCTPSSRPRARRWARRRRPPTPARRPPRAAPPPARPPPADEVPRRAAAAARAWAQRRPCRRSLAARREPLLQGTAHLLAAICFIHVRLAHAWPFGAPRRPLSSSWLCRPGALYSTCRFPQHIPYQRRMRTRARRAGAARARDQRGGRARGDAAARAGHLRGGRGARGRGRCARRRRRAPRRPRRGRGGRGARRGAPPGEGAEGAPAPQCAGPTMRRPRGRSSAHG